jgi:hypothetical protein
VAQGLDLPGHAVEVAGGLDLGRGDLNGLVPRPLEYLCGIGCQDVRAGGTEGVAVEDEDEREQCPVFALLERQVSMAGTTAAVCHRSHLMMLGGATMAACLRSIRA